MSEPKQEQISSDFFWQKIWPYRLPLVFFSLGIVFLLTGFFLLYHETTAGQSVVISEPSNSPNPSKPSLIRVDVSGSVVSPGVYELNSYARIQDALIKAGGLSADADRNFVSKNINLAQKLSDGAKIYIPSANENSNPSGLSSISNPSTLNHLININLASADELDSLPGIGPATAAKIISGRPYETIDDLLTKKAVGKSVLEKIKDRVTVY